MNTFHLGKDIADFYFFLNQPELLAILSRDAQEHGIFVNLH
jgi:hypothetical protein